MTRGITMKEVVTSDIGAALYLLGNGCNLIYTRYEEGKGLSHRYKMKFIGANADNVMKEYRSKSTVNIEFKKYLPQLFERLEAIKPDIVEMGRHKSARDYGYGD